MIAREGLPFIGIGLVLTLLFLLVSLRTSSLWFLAVAMLTGLLTLLCTYFFRDPPRTPPDDPLAAVAPADGRVVVIERLPEHPYVGPDAIQMSIFLSVLDVHVNRVPADGVIDFVRYQPGKFIPAYDERASRENEQTEIGLVMPDGVRLVFKQIAGVLARRIVCRLHEGQSVRRGERFGLIRFGSRMDLILPAGSEPLVRVGQRVRAGETVMARLPATVPRRSPETEEQAGGH